MFSPWCCFTATPETIQEGSSAFHLISHISHMPTQALAVYDAAARGEPLPPRCEQLHRATGLPTYLVVPVMNGADCVAALTLGHTHAAALRELWCVCPVSFCCVPVS